MRNEVERAITFKISDRIIIHKRVLVTGIIIFVELQLLDTAGDCPQGYTVYKQVQTNILGISGLRPLYQVVDIVSKP